MERTIHTAYVPYAYEQYKKLQLSLTNRATHLRANAMAWLTSEKHAPPHSGYHVEFGHSALKDVGINAGELPKLGSHGTPLSWDGRLG